MSRWSLKMNAGLVDPPPRGRNVKLRLPSPASSGAFANANNTNPRRSSPRLHHTFARTKRDLPSERDRFIAPSPFTRPCDAIDSDEPRISQFAFTSACDQSPFTIPGVFTLPSPCLHPPELSDLPDFFRFANHILNTPYQLSPVCSSL